jgi:hypothetical protein
MVQGKSNVGSPHDYSYKVRVTASPSQAIMEFVFDQVDNNTAPIPVRLVVDEAGNVSTSVLGSTEAEALRAQAAETCSTPAMSSADPSLNLLNPGGTLAQILAIHK